MIRVKLSFPYPDWPILRQTPDHSGIWKDCTFYTNDAITDCDYWVVFQNVLKKETVHCPRENTIFLTGEPISIQRYDQKFLNQFATVVTSQNEISHRNVVRYLTGHPWFVNKSYNQLVSRRNVNKTKKISIITSNKNFTEGHKKRYEFCLNLKDYFQNEIDLFGRGIQSFEDKWDILAPYKYSICIENDFIQNWVTEKLFDCYLSHTFPIYYGCPNISRFFNEKSLQRIDINDIDSSIAIIEHILDDEDHYRAHLKHVIEAKNNCLNKYNLFPLISDIIRSHEKRAGGLESKKEKITISPERMYRKLYNYGIKRVRNIYARSDLFCSQKD
jgi:hypothetical protein